MLRRLVALGLALAICPVAFGQDDAKAKEEEAKKKLEEFKAAIKKCKAESDFVDALEDLGKTQHPKILAELKTWLGKPSKEVRIAAAEQIGKYQKDKEAAEMLMAAANAQKDADVAVKCVRYAGDTSYKGIAGKLIALYRHKDVDLAHEAIDSSAKIKAKDCVDGLIAVVKDLEAVKDDANTPGGPSLPGPGAGPQGQEDERMKRKRECLQPAHSALKAITGEKWTTAREWEIWWKKNKGTFKESE